MDKKEYLIRTFSRTKRKDYENYILNAVWQQMDYLTIRPVTQQYVKSSSNEYYLIDLYFPQLNIGVEVDEAYHQSNVELDKIRALDISNKLAAVPQTSDFKLFRIDATLSLEDLNFRIKEVADAIRKQAQQQNINYWDTDVPIETKIREKGYLSVDDYYQFDRIVDVANDLFMKGYNGYQQAVFKAEIDAKLHDIWFPTISTPGQVEHLEWHNSLNDDWTEIKEVNTRKDNKLITINLDKVRIVFARMRNPFGQMRFRYIGNFQAMTTTDDFIERTHRKISDRIYIDFDTGAISLEPII